MTRLCKLTAMPMLTCLLGLAAHAASFEGLKAGTLSGAWESALKNSLFVPAVPSAKPVTPLPVFPAQVLTYERGGYTWESDAQNSANTAAENLRSAGIAVLNTQILRESQSPWRYSFRVEYLDDSADPTLPPRTIETYTSGNYTWSSDAENALHQTESNLGQAGYAVILGEVLRQQQAPWNYFYRVDYIRGRRNPGGGQTYIYTSGLYPRLIDAQRDLYAVQFRLQSQGYQIYSSMIFQDARTKLYFFQIQYGTRWLRRNR